MGQVLALLPCAGREKGPPPPPEFNGVWGSCAVAVHARLPGAIEPRKAMGLPEPDFNKDFGKFSYLAVDCLTTNIVVYDVGNYVRGKAILRTPPRNKEYNDGMQAFSEHVWTCKDDSLPPITFTDKKYVTFEGRQVLVGIEVEGTPVERIGFLNVVIGDVPMTLAVLYSEWGELEPVLLKATAGEEEQIIKRSACESNTGPEPMAKLAQHDEADGDPPQVLKGAAAGKKEVLVHKASSREL